MDMRIVRVSQQAIESRLAIVEELKSVTQRFVEVEKNFNPQMLTDSIFLELLFHELDVAIQHAEAIKLSREEVLEIIEPIRQVVAQSPGCFHIQTWPRGYAGDFEIIEQIVSRDNKSIPNSFFWLLEEYFLSSMIAEQHRNKIRYQANLILNTILSSQQPANILLIAAGGATDLRSIAEQVKNENFHVVLNDIEADALKVARAHLKSIEEKCDFVPSSVFHSIKDLAKYGPYDLIIAGGLFDYLSTKHIEFLFRNMLTKLAKPGGLMYFSNIKTGNPYRILMEYTFNWPLVERDDKEVIALLKPFEAQISDIKIEYDLTNLTLLTTFRKNNH